MKQMQVNFTMPKEMVEYLRKLSTKRFGRPNVAAMIKEAVYKVYGHKKTKI